MEFLKSFSEGFLDKIIDNYTPTKEGVEPTEEDVSNLDNIELKVQLRSELEDFREDLDSIIDNLRRINNLIKDDSSIDQYLKTSLEELREKEFNKTLVDDDGEPETRRKLDQENDAKANDKFELLKSEFKEGILKLNELIKDLIEK